MRGKDGPLHANGLLFLSRAGKRHQDVQVQRHHLPAPEPVRAVQASGQPLLPGSAHLTGRDRNVHVSSHPQEITDDPKTTVFVFLSDYSRHHHFALVHDPDSPGGGAGNYWR